MDGPRDPGGRKNSRTDPVFPAHQTQADEEHESRQHRQDHPVERRQQQPGPRHRRSATQGSSSDVVRLANPGAQEVSHSPYPIPANAFIQHAIQFYVKEYSPTAVQRPHFVGVGQDLALLRNYIPFIMNDSMVFSALVAMASFSASITSTGSREAPPESFRLYQSAVSQLRERLAREAERASDAVIVTLSNLSGFEALSGNYDAVDMHTLGIKQVVALRGGVDQLGFEGFLQTMAIAWQNFYAARHSISLDDERFFPADRVFTYPEHPFDPDLCDTIARFHPGLTDVALSGLLSHQIINLVAHVNAWEQGINTCLRESDVYSLHEFSPSALNVTLCGEFLHKRGLSPIEQLLVIALMAFCFSTDTTRAMFYLANAFLQIQCKFIRSLSIEVTEKNEAFMTWVGTLLVATFDPSGQPCLLGIQLLRARPNARNWQANVRLCETYFWNDALSLRLASKIGHLAGMERQGLG
ncbi:hypothetical protein PV04_01655 [Phialophora macrospora]|uniref:Transcription factor domain-containing protein n=1 Tax=Phialophora macrospora TaxID=1851006 RepID=A0A0D2FYE2_9EURO|nr:hypothetical protein PV04_01655 [Phialophora macrospora]